MQGTDVIEETAFAWDLLPLPPKPVVVVGAMRSASQEGYDGPENLRNAVAAAADPALAGQGVVVAMAGELHGADDVRKTHTHALRHVPEPERRPAGHRGRWPGDSSFGSAGRRGCRASRTRAALPVPLLTAVLDDDGPRSIGCSSRGRPGWSSLRPEAATPPRRLLELGPRPLMAAGVPVVLTTRCPSGRRRPGYGFPGRQHEWWEAGAIFTRHARRAQGAGAPGARPRRRRWIGGARPRCASALGRWATLG